MKINQVEQLVGITKGNIRFYEKEGLLTPGRNNHAFQHPVGVQPVQLAAAVPDLGAYALGRRQIGLPAVLTIPQAPAGSGRPWAS